MENWVPIHSSCRYSTLRPPDPTPQRSKHTQDRSNSTPFHHMLEPAISDEETLLLGACATFLQSSAQQDFAAELDAKSALKSQFTWRTLDAVGASGVERLLRLLPSQFPFTLNPDIDDESSDGASDGAAACALATFLCQRIHVLIVRYRDDDVDDGGGEVNETIAAARRGIVEVLLDALAVRGRRSHLPEGTMAAVSLLADLACRCRSNASPSTAPSPDDNEGEETRDAAPDTRGMRIMALKEDVETILATVTTRRFGGDDVTALLRWFDAPPVVVSVDTALSAAPQLPPHLHLASASSLCVLPADRDARLMGFLRRCRLPEAPHESPHNGNNLVDGRIGKALLAALTADDVLLLMNVLHLGGVMIAQDEVEKDEGEATLTTTEETSSPMFLSQRVLQFAVSCVLQRHAWYFTAACRCIAAAMWRSRRGVARVLQHDPKIIVAVVDSVRDHLNSNGSLSSDEGSKSVCAALSVVAASLTTPEGLSHALAAGLGTASTTSSSSDWVRLWDVTMQLSNRCITHSLPLSLRLAVLQLVQCASEGVASSALSATVAVSVRAADDMMSGLRQCLRIVWPLRESPEATLRAGLWQCAASYVDGEARLVAKQKQQLRCASPPSLDGEAGDPSPPGSYSMVPTCASYLCTSAARSDERDLDVRDAMIDTAVKLLRWSTDLSLELLCPSLRALVASGRYGAARGVGNDGGASSSTFATL